MRTPGPHRLRHGYGSGMEPLPRSHGADPLESLDLARLLTGFGAPWWVGGGVALDLFAGEQSRAHFDVDVWILRRDGPRLRRHLGGWDLRMGIPGQNDHSRFPAYDERSDDDRAAYGVWATPPSSAPTPLEFLLQDAQGPCWRFRYRPSIAARVADIGLEAAAGLPIVRPELVLLSKSLRRREVDEDDFRTILPSLAPARREYLAALLAQVDSRHPWLPALESAGRKPWR